ncbi:MAG: hypothetical protein GX022_10375 [Clostridiaceae bacterium]|nr:hypothetical protein [Clostridiaceae bacterium]
MTKDYKIIFTSVGEIVSIPDSQDIYECLCKILAEKGYADLNKTGENNGLLAVSCVMPENTVLRPLFPLDFGKRKIESEGYPLLKKIKKIKYISTDLMPYISGNHFYENVLVNLSAGKWDVRNGILATTHGRVNFNLEEYITGVRVMENGVFVTKSRRLIKTNNSRFQIYIRTNISNIENLLSPGTRIDMGVYNVFELESVKEFYIVETKKGILISKYCPVDISKEIDIKNSYFKVGIRNGIKYIMEGSVLKPTRYFAGSIQENKRNKAKLNGKGYLLYI